MSQQLDFFDQMGAAQEVSTDIYDFIPGLYTQAAGNAYLETLIAEVPWTQTSLLISGKSVLTPRLTASFGDPDAGYDKREPLPWRQDLLDIKEKVEQTSGISFNGVLLNYYRDGNDSVAWHSDRDGIPGRNRYVASVSFGQERLFDVRNIVDHSTKFSLPLTNGSYLLMKGDFQEHWQHRIPKSRKPMGPRVNLTFRVYPPIH